ncbi:MAG: hypothetical protein KA715_02135 [Xanthomonadaceae bacterium]|nr:hypothetical protein [Xanthomonadaceae bacterium]
MKLDLINFGEVALISVFAEVSPENVPVMMAGVRKIKESNPVVVILDLSEAKPTVGAVSALKAVRTHPGYVQLGLKMVSTVAEISDSPDLKTVLDSLKSKIAAKILEWQKLNIQVIALRAKEKEASDKMGGRALSEDIFLKLVAKNNALNKFHPILAAQADGVLKTLRGLQMDAKDFQETRSRYEAVLVPFQEALKRKGLL